MTYASLRSPDDAELHAKNQHRMSRQQTPAKKQGGGEGGGEPKLRSRPSYLWNLFTWERFFGRGFIHLSKRIGKRVLLRSGNGGEGKGNGGIAGNERSVGGVAGIDETRGWWRTIRSPTLMVQKPAMCDGHGVAHTIPKGMGESWQAGDQDPPSFSPPPFFIRGQSFGKFTPCLSEVKLESPHDESTLHRRQPNFATNPIPRQGTASG
ncbi:hypothetical protein BDK51DRAFT_30984 [Blyttiomyces helicus]|uniref:Uncharacterized protein n=1 Tax=Blyttiomyces helicus TaxID=388810 RepID=A0A4P9VUT0_9FUNG|nr:hypothetical protein BDK51DRAFT_30984 [Blyttiomyces helicus]|eukprot:RKO82862.1 hypothetical protein BDK51DRAFT_30984 [Blyttiomyces helicus]